MYYDIIVASEDIQKISVVILFGLFEYFVMPFGLKNATQTFQWLIDGITRDLPFVYVYINDIVIIFTLERSIVVFTLYLDL